MKMRRYDIGGIPVRTYLDDVNDFREMQPKYISSWGRADSIYHWIGSIVRLKPRYWRGKTPPPYGLVIEVGRAAWLAALWTDGTSPSEHINGCDVEHWWSQGIHDLKYAILERKYSEEELHDYLRSLDFSDLTKVS